MELHQAHSTAATQQYLRKPCSCKISTTGVALLAHLLGCAVVASCLPGVDEHGAIRQHDARRATRPMGIKPAMLLFQCTSTQAYHSASTTNNACCGVKPAFGLLCFLQAGSGRATSLGGHQGPRTPGNVWMFVQQLGCALKDGAQAGQQHEAASYTWANHT